ncbi:MAG TPA: UDP-N-acetylglucosamine 1-carboxyvinyltransferase [Pirellulales bacterium]|nr:UDP-N-acetylglucosamine 1-carboxyvinyltransferase [Pirellulales bacterium]
MNGLWIRGPTRMVGQMTVSGSKNAALPIMAASLLTDQPVRLSRVPELTDTATLERLLRTLGMAVERRGNQVHLETLDCRPVRADRRLVRRMRASFCVLGPLLARRRRAVVPLPGGCRIGDRPIDLHLRGLAALGAEIAIQRGHVVARAKRLRGARIDLTGPRGPTVTGTANLLSAAVLARGTTVLTGAAREPEIVDLGRFLESLGAIIDGLGTDTITVRGVAGLGGGDYTILPDRIETATLLLAAAVTRGAVLLTGAAPEQLTAVLDCLCRAGAAVETTATSIRLAMSGPPVATSVVAQPYPGFPTDVQAQWTALMCLSEGVATIRDDVFPQRFSHVAELRRLGGQLMRRGAAVRVTGVEAFCGGTVAACDLRASAALVLAGLAGHGETRIRRAYHLDRGYECYQEKLTALGAKIARIAPAAEAVIR